MKTLYVLGSLDAPLYLIVHSHHPTAKKLISYETTEDDGVATRFDFFSTAAWVLLTLGQHYPAIAALNLMPLPIKDGSPLIPATAADQFELPL